MAPPADTGPPYAKVPPYKHPRRPGGTWAGGGRGGGGGVAEWQQQQQQSQLWQVRVISPEAAVRDLEQRLAKANDATRAAEVERDTLRRDKERLTAKAGGGGGMRSAFFRIFRIFFAFSGQVP